MAVEQIDGPVRSGPVEESGRAWIAAAPAAALTLLLMLVLAAPLGRLLFPTEASGFWATARLSVQPEPTEDARYLIALLGAVLVPSFVFWSSGRLRHLAVPRGVVIAQQLAFVAILFLAVFCRRGSVHLDFSYFDLPTAIVAAVIGVGTVASFGHPALLGRARAIFEHRSRLVIVATSAVAVAATVVWLLPAIQFDSTIGHSQPASMYDLKFTFDESLSVIDGRSPLVDYVAQYGSLWPYVIAIPFDLGNGSLAAFTIWHRSAPWRCCPSMR